LRFQFRDAKGTPADWLVRIDFTGWRLQVLRTSDRPEFDWSRTEYLIYYFNDIPSKATVALRLDDVKAIRELRPPPLLVHPEVTVNDQRVMLPLALGPGQGVTIDEQGRCTIWPLGPGKPRPAKCKPVPIRLQPGENRVTLSCEAAKGAPRDVTGRVVAIGE